MSFWKKNNKIVIDDTGKPIDCDVCPCVGYWCVYDTDLGTNPTGNLICFYGTAQEIDDAYPDNSKKGPHVTEEECTDDCKFWCIYTEEECGLRGIAVCFFGSEADALEQGGDTVTGPYANRAACDAECVILCCCCPGLINSDMPDPLFLGWELWTANGMISSGTATMDYNAVTCQWEGADACGADAFTFTFKCVAGACQFRINATSVQYGGQLVVGGDGNFLATINTCDPVDVTATTNVFDGDAATVICDTLVNVFPNANPFMVFNVTE